VSDDDDGIETECPTCGGTARAVYGGKYDATERDERIAALEKALRDTAVELDDAIRSQRPRICPQEWRDALDAALKVLK
jgi:hypothetical protein